MTKKYMARRRRHAEFAEYAGEIQIHFAQRLRREGVCLRQGNTILTAEMGRRRGLPAAKEYKRQVCRYIIAKQCSFPPSPLGEVYLFLAQRIKRERGLPAAKEYKRQVKRRDADLPVGRQGRGEIQRNTGEI